MLYKIFVRCGIRTRGIRSKTVTLLRRLRPLGQSDPLCQISENSILCKKNGRSEGEREKNMSDAGIEPTKRNTLSALKTDALTTRPIWPFVVADGKVDVFWFYRSAVHQNYDKVTVDLNDYQNVSYFYGACFRENDQKRFPDVKMSKSFLEFVW